MGDAHELLSSINMAYPALLTLLISHGKTAAMICNICSRRSMGDQTNGPRAAWLWHVRRIRCSQRWERWLERAHSWNGLHEEFEGGLAPKSIPIIYWQSENFPIRLTSGEAYEQSTGKSRPMQLLA